jgi:hypothetical protein
MASQFSSDSFAGQLANQTNLGVKVCILPGELSPTYGHTPLKSIVALKAAAEIFNILGDSDKSQQYNVRSPIPSSRSRMLSMSAAERRHFIPATMANRRALFRQVSLHSLIWGQPVVSTTGGLETTFPVLM